MLPGAIIFCICTVGCNNPCKFCQNWHLSQQRIEDIEHLATTPEQTVEMALKSFCDAVSFTYNEPTIFYEHKLPRDTMAGTGRRAPAEQRRMRPMANSLLKKTTGSSRISRPCVTVKVKPISKKPKTRTFFIAEFGKPTFQEAWSPASGRCFREGDLFQSGAKTDPPTPASRPRCRDFADSVCNADSGQTRWPSQRGDSGEETEARSWTGSPRPAPGSE